MVKELEGRSSRDSASIRPCRYSDQAHSGKLVLLQKLFLPRASPAPGQTFTNTESLGFSMNSTSRLTQGSSCCQGHDPLALNGPHACKHSPLLCTLGLGAHCVEVELEQQTLKQSCPLAMPYPVGIRCRNCSTSYHNR